MSRALPPADKDRTSGPLLLLLEWLTGAVLILVLASLGWMVVAAYLPAWGRWLPVEAEVNLVLVLLTAALVLVSALALLHTRR
jgi:hypothetical protein